MDILNTLKYRFKHAGIVEQLIYINLAVFLSVFFMNTFSFLFNIDKNLMVNWFSLPSNFNEFLYKPWTIITYGFLHTNFIHILFNLIILYFIGNLFIQYFTTKQLIAFYIYGTLTGGLIFLGSYNFFPVFKDLVNNSVLIGASAGVSAILIGIATYIPNYTVKIPLIGHVKLWHIAAFKIIIDIIQIPAGNAGGHFAHLGGALFGFLYVFSASNKELSIPNPFTGLFKRKSPLKTVYKSGKKQTRSATGKTYDQKEIDVILDKISKSGYDTLSKEEKEFLFKQGKK